MTFLISNTKKQMQEEKEEEEKEVSTKARPRETSETLCSDDLTTLAR